MLGGNTLRSFRTVLLLSALLLSAGTARADCCRVVKVDEEVPTSAVRVCTNDGAAGCGALLYEGPLALGSAEEVCPTTETVVYQEWDDALLEYGPPVVAVCGGDDVEL